MLGDGHAATVPWAAVRRLMVAAAVALVASTACRPDTVRLAYRPSVGEVAGYAVRTETETEVEIPGEPVRRANRVLTLVATHTVVANDPDGARVRVVLDVPGQPARQLVVRLDRSAQLREVVAAAVTLPGDLDDLGLPELFPPAAGAPPARPLRLGDRWRIAETVRLPGQGPTRLTGSGELAALGTENGRRVARVRWRNDLDVARSTATGGLRLALRGRQRTVGTTTYDIDDGSVVAARALTTGDFRVVLRPPADAGAPPPTGSFRLTVRSDVRRTH